MISARYVTIVNIPQPINWHFQYVEIAIFISLFLLKNHHFIACWFSLSYKGGIPFCSPLKLLCSATLLIVPFAVSHFWSVTCLLNRVKNKKTRQMPGYEFFRELLSYLPPNTFFKRSEVLAAGLLRMFASSTPILSNNANNVFSAT